MILVRVLSRTARSQRLFRDGVNGVLKLTANSHATLPNSTSFSTANPTPLSDLTSPSTKQESINNLYDDVDYNAITNGDEELLKKLKVLMLEVEVMRQDGQKIPSKMNTERWSEVLLLSTRSQRIKQLAFWWLNERKKETDKRKKEEKRMALEKRPELPDDGHIKYGFGGNTIFIRVYDTTIDNFYNQILIQAMMFGQKMVIDCGYSENMNAKECSNCAKQLTILFAQNRVHKEPFSLYFCNARNNSLLLQKFHKHIPTLYSDTFPLNITEKSYLDIFPKDKLVYLTPHCRDELLEYDHDAVYIIGALVDRVNNEPLSLAKAKAEGIKMARLPLDRHLHWSVGTKSLTLNQVLNIMLDMKVYKDWNKALVHVPKRKLKTEEELVQEMRRSDKRFFKKRYKY